MTWTNRRHLFKNKGNFVYNYKLKEFEHMSKTPLQLLLFASNKKRLI